MFLDDFGNTLAVSFVETITGGDGADAVTLTEVLLSGHTVDLGGGADVLNLAGGTNTGTMVAEFINGTAGDDVVNLENVITTDTTISGGGGGTADRLTLANGGNVVIVGGFETITGSDGNDTIRVDASGLAADTPTIDGGDGTNDIFIYNAEADITQGATELGDIINFETWLLEDDHSYTLTLSDNNVGNGDVLTITATNIVTGSNDVTIDASAELDGILNFNGGAGDDTVTLGNVQTTGSFDGGGGSGDVLNLVSGTNQITIANFETVNTGNTNDVLILQQPVSNVSFVDAGGAADQIKVASSLGPNSLALSGFETLTMGSADDTVVLTNAQTGLLVLGDAGTDTLVLANATNSISIQAMEVVQGGTGVDTITVAAGNATLIGGGGNDTLGSNTTGSDVFVYEAANDSGLTSANRDVINNFDAAAGDLIFLDRLLEGSITYIANEGAFTSGNDTEASFNDTTKVLHIDIDGNGSADMEILLSGVDVADLDANTGFISGSIGHTVSGTGSATLTASVRDDVEGSSGDDVISLSGLAESGDEIDGLAGTDTLTLTSGTNVFRAENIEVINVSSAGADTVTLEGSLTGVTIDLGDNTDELILQGGGGTYGVLGVETVTGSSGGDIITVNDATATTVDAGAGNDVIAGGSGGNVLNGEGGQDDITGGAGNDDISGGDADDIFNMSLGNDTVSGGAGTDTLKVDAGAFVVESITYTNLQKQSLMGPIA